ncbi:MAG TPA: M17 family peptidase N-terminal domain-containing protein [Smithellaceae bacterium]|nr:M17 family peptidase N-terminal domain-containing protein [Smithellaceae bacterium]
MQVTISTEAPDLPVHKCLALGIFSDEKPPRGVCGFIDWRLNGFISAQMKQGRINGAFREKTVIPFPRRIGTEIVFLFGLGAMAEFNPERIYTSAYQIISTVDGLHCNKFAFDLPGENRGLISTAVIVEAMLAGFFDYLSRDIEKLADMTSCIVVSPTGVQEVTAGIQRFKSSGKDMGAVDVGDLESSFA